MAQRFANYSRAEAEAYLAHPVLGPRLLECTRLVLAVKDRNIHGIFGSSDDMKLRSSMNLVRAVSANPVFAQALEAFYDGEQDRATLGQLKAMGSERPRAEVPAALALAASKGPQALTSRRGIPLHP